MERRAQLALTVTSCVVAMGVVGYLVGEFFPTSLLTGAALGGVDKAYGVGNSYVLAAPRAIGLPFDDARNAIAWPHAIAGAALGLLVAAIGLLLRPPVAHGRGRKRASLLAPIVAGLGGLGGIVAIFTVAHVARAAREYRDEVTLSQLRARLGLEPKRRYRNDKFPDRLSPAIAAAMAAMAAPSQDPNRNRVVAAEAYIFLLQLYCHVDQCTGGTIRSGQVSYNLGQDGSVATFPGSTASDTISVEQSTIVRDCVEEYTAAVHRKDTSSLGIILKFPIDGGPIVKTARGRDAFAHPGGTSAQTY